MIKVWQPQIQAIVGRWNAGHSTGEIVASLDLPITERQVRRIGAAHGNWRLRQLARIERHEAVENSATSI